MHIKYHTEKLNHVIKNLAELLHISIIVFDNCGRALTRCSDTSDYCSLLQKHPEFSKKCLNSDLSLMEKCHKTKKVEVHFCHAGLCDLAIPIIKDDILAAYVILGRIRLSDSPEKSPYDIPDKSADILYNSITKFTDNQLKNLIALLPHIIFDTAITLEKNVLADDIAQFIRSELSSEISVKSLCTKYYISKNTLYKLFSEAYQCTVNEFVTSVRIEEAKKQLLNTKLSVMQICENVGITNYTYFCKLFKKHTGFSPLKYRTKK